MGYAVKTDGTGWRAINSAGDCVADEDFSESQPIPKQPTVESIRLGVLQKVKSELLPVFAALDIMRQDELVKITTSADLVAVELAKTNARAIQTFIQGLRDIKLIELTGTEAQMLTTVLLAYKALVAAAPTALKPQFKAALANK